MNIAPLQPITPVIPLPPVAATAMVQPQQAPGVPRPPSPYAELYNLPAADAHRGVYGPILAIFVAEHADG